MIARPLVETKRSGLITDNQALAVRTDCACSKLFRGPLDICERPGVCDVPQPNRVFFGVCLCARGRRPDARCDEQILILCHGEIVHSRETKDTKFAAILMHSDRRVTQRELKPRWSYSRFRRKSRIILQAGDDRVSQLLFVGERGVDAQCAGVQSAVDRNIPQRLRLLLQALGLALLLFGGSGCLPLRIERCFRLG